MTCHLTAHIWEGLSTGSEKGPHCPVTHQGQGYRRKQFRHKAPSAGGPPADISWLRYLLNSQSGTSCDTTCSMSGNCQKGLGQSRRPDEGVGWLEVRIIFLKIFLMLTQGYMFPIDVYIEWKEGRDTEKHQYKRHIDWLPPPCTPTRARDQACNRGMCPCPESNPKPFSPRADVLSTEPNLPGQRYRKDSVHSPSLLPQDPLNPNPETNNL